MSPDPGAEPVQSQLRAAGRALAAARRAHKKRLDAVEKLIIPALAAGMSKSAVAREGCIDRASLNAALARLAEQGVRVEDYEPDDPDGE